MEKMVSQESREKSQIQNYELFYKGKNYASHNALRRCHSTTFPPFLAVSNNTVGYFCQTLTFISNLFNKNHGTIPQCKMP